MGASFSAEFLRAAKGYCVRKRQEAKEALQLTAKHIEQAPPSIRTVWALQMLSMLVMMIAAVVAGAYILYVLIQRPSDMPVGKLLLWGVLAFGLMYGGKLPQLWFAVWFSRWLERQPDRRPPPRDIWKEAMANPSRERFRQMIDESIDRAPFWLKTHYAVHPYIELASALASAALMIYALYRGSLSVLFPWP